MGEKVAEKCPSNLQNSAHVRSFSSSLAGLGGGFGWQEWITDTGGTRAADDDVSGKGWTALAVALLPPGHPPSSSSSSAPVVFFFSLSYAPQHQLSPFQIFQMRI